MATLGRPSCHANLPMEGFWVSRLTLYTTPQSYLRMLEGLHIGLEASRNIGHHWTILGKVDLFWTCPQKVSKSERGWVGNFPKQIWQKGGECPIFPQTAWLVTSIPPTFDQSESVLSVLVDFLKGYSGLVQNLGTPWFDNLKPHLSPFKSRKWRFASFSALNPAILQVYRYFIPTNAHFITIVELTYSHFSWWNLYSAPAIAIASLQATEPKGSESSINLEPMALKQQIMIISGVVLAML